MNKIFMIGFLGGFSTIICLLYNKNSDINNSNIKVKFNNKVDIIDRYIIDDKLNGDKLDYDRYRLIIYKEPRPIYEVYIKNEWEILN